MRTLDEVITALGYCLKSDQMGNCNGDCPYIHCCDPESVAIKTDALHYLKEYKKWKNPVYKDNCAIDYQSWE